MTPSGTLTANTSIYMVTNDQAMNLHFLTDMNSTWTNNFDDAYDADLKINAVQRTPAKIDYKSLRPFFLNASANVVARTLDATTHQYAKHIASGPDPTSPHFLPAMYVAATKMSQPTLLKWMLHQSTLAESSMRKSSLGKHRWSLTSMASRLVPSLSTHCSIISDNGGAMDQLISDRAALEISKRAQDVL
jgi:hypothetical protein